MEVVGGVQRSGLQRVGFLMRPSVKMRVLGLRLAARFRTTAVVQPVSPKPQPAAGRRRVKR